MIKVAVFKDLLACRNASENPAGIETKPVKGGVLPSKYGRNASENPAGIETRLLASKEELQACRNASENPAGIETMRTTLTRQESGLVATHQKTQQGLKPDSPSE